MGLPTFHRVRTAWHHPVRRAAPDPSPCCCCSSPSCRSRAPRTARPDDRPRRLAATARRRDPLRLLRRRPGTGTRSPRAPRTPTRRSRSTVPEGTRHSRLEASIGWKDKRIDLDLYVYRIGAAGRAGAPGRRALGRPSRRATERAIYAPSGRHRRAGPLPRGGRQRVLARRRPTRARAAGRLRDRREPARRRGRLRGHGDARQPGAERRRSRGRRACARRRPRRSARPPSDADGTISHLPVRPRRRRHLRAGLRRHAGGHDRLPDARPAHDRRAGARRLGRGRVRELDRQRHARGARPTRARR